MKTEMVFNIKILCKVYNVTLDEMFEILMKCYMIDKNRDPFLDAVPKIKKEENEYYITDSGLDILFESTNLRVDNRWLKEKDEQVDSFLSHCINRVLDKMNNQSKKISELQAYRNEYNQLYSTLYNIKCLVDRILGNHYPNNNTNWV